MIAYLNPPQSLTDTLSRCCDLSYFSDAWTCLLFACGLKRHPEYALHKYLSCWLFLNPRLNHLSVRRTFPSSFNLQEHSFRSDHFARWWREGNTNRFSLDLCVILPLSLVLDLCQPRSICRLLVVTIDTDICQARAQAVLVRKISDDFFFFHRTRIWQRR